MDTDKSALNLFDRLGHLNSIYPNPYGNGNGNGRFHYWKGKPIIPDEDWERLAGYQDLFDVLTEEEKLLCKMTLDVPENALPKKVWDRANAEMIRTINPKSLNYFPNDIISVVFNPHYSCPEAPELHKEWVADYRELLIRKGYREYRDFDRTCFYRQTPEERYQEMKKLWDMHKSSWYRRGVNGYDGKGCNQYTGCIPECKFYAAEGRLNDGEGFD